MKPESKIDNADANRISYWIRPEIRALSAYHVPNPGNLIKLDAMENPYTWPESLIDQWLEVLRDVSLNRYPDPNASRLKDRLREAMKVPDTMDILLGNGSDELIQIIAMGISGSNRAILAPEPTFSMYRMIATFIGLEFIGVPLRNDFSLDLPALLATIEQKRPAITFLSYPNNPTGNLFDPQQIKEIIHASPGLVVVDEAYHAFAGRSFMNELANHDNLLVLRTVSKMGLAGLRLGLLAGPRAWLQEFDKIRLPYNINILTQVSAEFALNHGEVFDEQTGKIRAERERLFTEMNHLKGITVYPSQANFLLFRTFPEKAGKIFDSLKTSGVLIKNLSPAGEQLTDCLRVTVGRPEENDTFIQALKKALAVESGE